MLKRPCSYLIIGFRASKYKNNQEIILVVSLGVVITMPICITLRLTSGRLDKVYGILYMVMQQDKVVLMNFWSSSDLFC